RASARRRCARRGEGRPSVGVSARSAPFLTGWIFRGAERPRAGRGSGGKGLWGFPRSGNERAAPFSLPVNFIFPRWSVARPGVAGRGGGRGLEGRQPWGYFRPGPVRRDAGGGRDGCGAVPGPGAASRSWLLALVTALVVGVGAG